MSLKRMFEPNEPLQILCLGAHSDDIEIGCGATIFRLISEYPNIRIRWMVFGSTGIRAEEALNSANEILRDVKDKAISIKGFRDGYFPYIGNDIKEDFEKMKIELRPDIIFTHFEGDRHQDHRLISELTWNTFRNHLILEYEVPKYDGDLGTPNFFVHLDEVVCQWKVQHLMQYFKSQIDKHWFTEDTFWALLRLRGMESVSPGNHAEAFYCRKIVF